MAFSGKATYSAGADLPEFAEDVSDIVGIVSPHETPLLDHLGDAKRAATSTVHEWIEDALQTNTGTINQTNFSPNPQADNSIVVRDTSVFHVGDLVRPDASSEVMLVGAVSVSTSTIIFIRGYGGTSPAALADGMVLHVLGNAALEGADAPSARFTTRRRRQNYTQILTASIEVSGSAQASNAHAVADEVDYQKQERTRELLRDLENVVVNAVASASDPQGSSTVRRTMNGLVHSIASNVFRPGQGPIPNGAGSSFDQLNEPVLNAALKEIWEQSSGTIDTIVVGGAQKRRINTFASMGRSYAPEDTAYRDMIGVYESDFGVCRVIMSRFVPADRVLLLDSGRIDVMPLQGRSFHFKELAATGDSVAGQIIGEYTLEFRNENAHGLITGLAA